MILNQVTDEAIEFAGGWGSGRENGDAVGGRDAGRDPDAVGAESGGGGPSGADSRRRRERSSRTHRQSFSGDHSIEMNF